MGDDGYSEAGWAGVRCSRRVESGRKIDLLVFSGEDAYCWLLRIKRYFHVNQIKDVDKLELVLVAMEGDTLTWPHWWEDKVPFPSWREFKADLVKRFQPGVAHTPYGPLLQVQQISFVAVLA